jgi:hypothetical protein
MLGLLLWDRVRLGRILLFKYTDEDQAVLWNAANDLLHGWIPEPCFYGQSFNSCVEGLLAAPLVLLHVPYWIAVPTITIVLGLFPFLLMAWFAWRRGQSWLAALALLVPLALPVRYAILTGIPMDGKRTFQKYGKAKGPGEFLHRRAPASTYPASPCAWANPTWVKYARTSPA